MVHGRTAKRTVWKGTTPSEDEMLKDQLAQDGLARGPFGEWIKWHRLKD